MAADPIQVDFEQLQKVAQLFEQEQGHVRQIHRNLESDIQMLKTGGWLAEAADVYAKKMDDEVLPGIQRLDRAYGHASETTRQIIQIFEKADEEAAGFLRGEGESFWDRFSLRDLRNLAGIPGLFQELGKGFKYKAADWLTEKIATLYGDAIGGDDLAKLNNKFGFLENHGTFLKKVGLPGVLDGLIDFGVGGNYNGKELATQIISGVAQSGLLMVPVVGPAILLATKADIAAGLVETGLRAVGADSWADTLGNWRDTVNIDKNIDKVARHGVDWISNTAGDAIDYVKNFFRF